MKKTQTYAVIDTVTGSVIGNGLTAEEATQCIFLNTEGSANTRFETYAETAGLVKYLYDLAATLYSDGAEAWSEGDKQGADQCHQESNKLLDIAVELEEIHEAEADLYWGSSFDVELDEHEVLL
jgi:hypothetical protein